MSRNDEEIELILDQFNRKNSATRTNNKKAGNEGSVKNLNVREQNFRKSKNSKKKNNVKLKLKRLAASFLATAVIAGSGALAYKIYTDVEIPEGFDYSGISVSSRSNLPDEIKNDFVLIEVNSWKEGVSEKSIENIKKCNSAGIPCGILLNSEALTISEAKADATCIVALIENQKIDCPIYYNIDKIVDKVSQEDLLKMCNSFNEICRKGNESEYGVGISATAENFEKLGESISHFDKMVISDNKNVGYDGEYDMCYFTRTGQYFSSNSYGKENVNSSEETQGLNSDLIATSEYDVAIKGIDVSQYQGDIDWETVKAQGVNYAIIRFSSFSGFHENGKLNIDDKFYENIAECKRLDIPFGIYCYTKAETEAEALAEAEAVLNRLDGLDLDMTLPIYYDIEMDKHFNDPELSAKLCKAFCDRVKEAGYQSGIYASYSLFKDMVNKDSSIEDYRKWVAYYKYDEKRDYNDVTEEHIPEITGIGKYDIVQVTQYGDLTGIDENTVDVNYDTSGVSLQTSTKVH